MVTAITRRTFWFDLKQSRFTTFIRAHPKR